MAIKVKAQQQLMNVGPKTGKLLFVMRTENYSTLDEEKVFAEASAHSGMPVGALRACWFALGDILKNWLTEGHSIPVPGLGSMRFGVNGKAVEDINEVSAELIKTRKVIFTPSVAVKQALNNTAISVVCYDANGGLIQKEEVEGEDAA